MKQAALMCYQLFLGDTSLDDISQQDLDALAHVSGAAVSAQELMQVTNRLRGHHSYADLQHLLLNRQSQLSTPALLSEADATEFLQELFGRLDHATLYDHGVTANITSLVRGKTSASGTEYPGNMPCWTVHLTIGGSGLFINDHMEVRVDRGTMMLFHPDAIYHSGLYPSAASWKHYWALFQPRQHWHNWMEWREIDDGICLLQLTAEQPAVQMEQLFESLISMNHDTTPQRSDLQHNRLEEILIHASSHVQAAAHTRIDPRVERACAYMQAYMAERWSISDVARACNLSNSRLAHLFKEQLGVSPKFWCNNLRLQQARKLLLGTTDSINGIANQVGYEDANQFTRYFKKSLGCSPREFRQSFAT